jgi:hypothetical protein
MSLSLLWLGDLPSALLLALLSNGLAKKAISSKRR